MEETDKSLIKEIVENLFMRWSALKLAVEHGMGGKASHQTALETMNYVYEFCVGNDNVTQPEIQEILEDIIEQEFDTICEDNSIFEISSLLTKYLNMISDKQYDALKSEVSSMPPCNTQWLKPNFKMEYSFESDSSGSSDENNDEKMDVCTNNTQAQESTSRRYAPSTDENGWTLVASKRK